MNKLPAHLVASCLLIIWGCNTQTKTSLRTLAERQAFSIDSLFQSLNQGELFQGGVVVTNRGETIYEQYFGPADRGWGIPIANDTKFDIASINKSMIAALVMKASEEGKLRLDDTLVDMLSDFSLTGKFHPEITLHHLLSHSSGLPDYDAVPESLRKDQFIVFKRLRFTNEAYVDFISQLQPVNDPGQQFYYSNFGFHLLCIILEKTYQMPFGEILGEKLTLPLGLTNTVSESSNEVPISKLALAYNYQETSGEWHQNHFIDLSLGRRIFSTAFDLNRWGQVMDNPGWLSEASLHLMKQNHLAGIDPKFSYGYGWVVIDENNKSRMIDLGISQPYIIHGGSTEGYKSMLLNIAEGEYIVSFLSNVGNRTREAQLAKEIVNILTQ